MFWILSFLAFVLAAAGYRSAAGARFPALASSFASGLLVGLGLAVALPVAAEAQGWPWSVAGAMGGFTLMLLFDRWVHPLCETCARSGVLVAMVLHALIDGALAGAGGVVAWGVLAHRLPEAFLTGALLRSMHASPVGAGGSIIVLHAAFGLSLVLTPATASLSGGMALVGGALLYLGLHRWHADDAASAWRMAPAGLAGVLVSLLLR